MYFKVDRDQKLWKYMVYIGTGCHKSYEKSGLQGVTKHGDVDIDGFTQNGLNHEIWVLSYPFHSHRLSLNITK